MHVLYHVVIMYIWGSSFNFFFSLNVAHFLKYKMLIENVYHIESLFNYLLLSNPWCI